jgi:hypothetical protein
MGYMPGFASWLRQEIFLYFTVSRLVEVNLAYLMGTRGSFPVVSGWGMKLTTHPHLAPRSRMVELYVHSLKRPYGMGLN